MKVEIRGVINFEERECSTEVTVRLASFFLKRSSTCTLRLEVKKYALGKDHGFGYQLLHLNQVIPVDQKLVQLDTKAK